MKWIQENLGLILAILLGVLACGVSLLAAYLIAVSDLPEWLKFFLLK